MRVLPLDVELSAFAKGAANELGKALDAQAGPRGAGAMRAYRDDFVTHAHAVGVDLTLTFSSWEVNVSDYLNDFFARFPGDPFSTAILSSPTAQSVGLGVALVPNDVTQDEDLVRYVTWWVIKDPTPPQDRIAGTPPDSARTAPPR